MWRWRLVLGIVFLLVAMSSFAFVAGEGSEGKSTVGVSQAFQDISKMTVIVNGEEYGGQWGDEPIRLWLMIFPRIEIDKDGDKWQKVSGYLESVDEKSVGLFKGRLKGNGEIFFDFQGEGSFKGIVLRDGVLEGFIRIGSEFEYTMKPLNASKKGQSANMLLPERDGKWYRLTDTPYYQGRLNVVYQTTETLGFDLNISQGARMGRISGVAPVKGDRAIYEDHLDFQLTFDFISEGIEIKQKGKNVYAGAGAGFNGIYTRKNPDESGYPSLVERKILTEAEDQILRKISGKYYERFFDSAMSVFTDGEDLDGFDAKVYQFGAPGLFTIIESIVMVNENGEMWAATIDNEKIEKDGKIVAVKSQVRYFTNTEMTHDVPRTIVKWRERFAKMPVIVPEGDI